MSVSSSVSFTTPVNAQCVRSCAAGLACCRVVTRSVRNASKAAAPTTRAAAGFPIVQNVRFVVSRIHSRLKGSVLCRTTDYFQEYLTNFLNLVCFQMWEYFGEFLPAQRYASAGYRDRNVSVRLSVRHALVLCQNEES